MKRWKSTVSPVFHAVETVKLTFNSKGIKTSSLDNKIFDQICTKKLHKCVKIDQWLVKKDHNIDKLFIATTW